MAEITMTVYKYEIKVEDFIEISMPKSAKILSVQVQNGAPCIWALVNPSAEPETRYFRLAGTGHGIEAQIQNCVKFVGTFQLQNGAFVGHLFEILMVPQLLAEALKSSFFSGI